MDENTKNNLIQTSVKMGWTALIIAIVFFFIYKIVVLEKNNPSPETTEDVELIEYDCTAQAIYDYCKQCHIKFPDIVVAQAMLESANMTSNIFRKQHNLFGMSCANSRLTTNISNKGRYATYYNWRESVIDYGILQIEYADCKSETAYFKWLESHYSEDSAYISKVKTIRENLKKKLNWK